MNQAVGPTRNAGHESRRPPRCGLLRHRGRAAAGSDLAPRRDDTALRIAERRRRWSTRGRNGAEPERGPSSNEDCLVAADISLADAVSGARGSRDMQTDTATSVDTISAALSERQAIPMTGTVTGLAPLAIGAMAYAPSHTGAMASSPVCPTMLATMQHTEGASPQSETPPWPPGKLREKARSFFKAQRVVEVLRAMEVDELREYVPRWRSFLARMRRTTPRYPPFYEWEDILNEPDVTVLRTRAIQALTDPEYWGDEMRAGAPLVGLMSDEDNMNAVMNFRALWSKFHPGQYVS